MTSFLRFIVLALTPLLGVSGLFGPSALYGLVTAVLLIAAASLAFLVRSRVSSAAALWLTVGLGVVFVTAVDIVVSLGAPQIRAAWGIYLNLLAFSPLVAVLPREAPPAKDLASGVVLAFKTGMVLLLLFAGTALLREVLGRGTVTLLPGTLVWALPILKDSPLTILATGAGGFFLAAAGVVAYRALRPQWLQLESVPLPAGSAPMVPAAAELPVEEPTEPWGETLEAVVASLGSGSSEKRRLLVIGSGNGEVAYYLSMLCLDHMAQGPFSFRVRGVDHFSTRVEAAVRGVYREHQIEFISPALRQQWMTQGTGDGLQWKVASEPRLHVQFEVADFQHGPLFFPQPCHIIVLNQGIEFVSEDKKAPLLKQVCDNLLPGGALVVPAPFPRESLPEGMKRTGTTVFRKVQ